jgi:hypothetical protein
MRFGGHGTQAERGAGADMGLAQLGADEGLERHLGSGLTELVHRSCDQATVDAADDGWVGLGEFEERAPDQVDATVAAALGGGQVGGVAPIAQHVDHPADLGQPGARSVSRR